MDYAAMYGAIVREVGGIDDAVDQLLSRYADFARRAATDRRYAKVAPSGVILGGIPGCGKTKLATTFARCSGLPFRVVHCPDLFFADQGKSEEKLIECFSSTEASANESDDRRVLVLEEIDVLSGSKRPNTMEARMFSLLLDCIGTHGNVFVVGTTSRLAVVPEELRRPGRLDSAIDVHLGDAAARAAVLRIMLRKFSQISLSDVDAIAKKAHGFSAADLQSLCLRVFMEHRGDATADNVLAMVEAVKPSNLSAFQSKIPRVLFADIFGLDQTIARVRSLVVEPLLHPEKYREMQVDPPRGALIHGPAGTGKSMLCCAVANELAINAIWVDASQMRSMIVGESEKAIAGLFAQARKSAPCIDALAPRRGTSQSSENTSDRIVTSLLVEMDGFGAHAGRPPHAPGVFVLAVTSRPHIVDPALLRPGRLDVHVGLSSPDAQQREAILAGYLKQTPATAAILANTDFVSTIVERTAGHTGADLANLCREAALNALRRNIESHAVTESDFMRCLDAGLR
ncbi:hypothetical protein IW152_000030 [Coemansia sp. BCRC 34962]|nr:hypothetical protein IW152_000030 [Coemansia sp. BCRC 34962]